jgi:hypothetical protein
MTVEESSKLESVVAALQAQVAAFQQNWQEQDRRATDGRKFMYEKIEGYARDVQSLTHQMAIVVRDVAEMKPNVQDWIASRNKAAGAAMVLRLVWIFGGAALGAAGWAIGHFLTIGPHAG